MMSKINFDKASDVAAMQSARQTDSKKTDTKIATDGGGKTGTAVNSDRLQFSDQASKVGELVDRIRELPDVRSEKVSVLKQQIASGSYNPSSEDIAAAILKQEGV